MNRILIASIGAMVLVNSVPAYAYLDPGSGSYIIQVTIGVIAGGIFMLKNYWSVIKGYAQKFLDKNKKND